MSRFQWDFRYGQRRSMVFPDTPQDLPDDKARAGSHQCGRHEELLHELATSNPQIASIRSSRCWLHAPSMMIMMLRNPSPEQPSVHVVNGPWWSTRTSKTTSGCSPFVHRETIQISSTVDQRATSPWNLESRVKDEHTHTEIHLLDFHGSFASLMDSCGSEATHLEVPQHAYFGP